MFFSNYHFKHTIILNSNAFFIFMISSLTNIFGSKTKAQEILYLLHDLKPVVRQGFYEHELPAVEQFCQEKNLSFVKSTFKVSLADNEAYSNKGIRIPLQDSRQGMIFVYISKSERDAHLACYYELTEDHRKLGEVLGYPDCCVEFFCRQFSEQNTNPQLPPTNLWTNLSQRDKDMVILSHFPCRSDCPQSIELGKKYLKVIQQEDSQRAEELQDNLAIL